MANDNSAKLELAREIAASAAQHFGVGVEIPNAALKGWMVATYPEHFGSIGQAANFVQKFLGLVDFAGAQGGYGVLYGILRDKDNRRVPEGTKGCNRFWVVPEGATLRTKVDAFVDGQLGSAAKTKMRRCPRMGEYVAALKDAE